MQPVEHSEFPLWCWQGCSSARSGCLERKGEERGHAKKGECHEMIPCEFLLQEEDGESDEDGDGNDLLNDLELESREMDIAEASRRHRQAVFEQRNPPRNQDRLPERPIVAIFQVPIPGEGHEDIGQNQQKEGAHKAGFRSCLSRVSGMKK